MECCYPTHCGEYAVSPMLVTPACTPKYCEEEPVCYPCLPRCQKPVYYCCEEKAHKAPPRTPIYDRDCCPIPQQKRCCTPRALPPPPPPPRHDQCCAPQPQQNCDSCCHHNQPCKPIKTKYIIPCYRYEDGRIERYVPTRYGKLPMSAYRRNGMQDQIHGYRGAIRYLCSGEGPNGMCCVHTSFEPMTNQPTLLTQRACEVACGTRARRKPFVVSSYAADPYNEIRRYHSEDERGNCCFHFERKKPPKLQPMCCSSRLTPGCMSCPECQYVDCVYAHPVDSPSCCYYIK